MWDEDNEQRLKQKCKCARIKITKEERSRMALQKFQQSLEGPDYHMDDLFRDVCSARTEFLKKKISRQRKNIRKMDKKHNELVGCRSHFAS